MAKNAERDRPVIEDLTEREVEIGINALTGCVLLGEGQTRDLCADAIREVWREIAQARNAELRR